MSGTNKAILSMSVLLIAALVVYYGMTPPESASGSIDVLIQNQPKARIPVFGGDPVQKLAEMGIQPAATAIAPEPEVNKVAVWHPIPIDPAPFNQGPVIEIKEPKLVLLPAAVIEKTYKLYIVAEGETLGEIAQRELGSYRMWRKIVALNNINDPSRISPGDVLRMPARSVVPSMVPVFEPMKPLGTVIHTVVEGDTCSSIAGDYFGDINLFGKILDANPMVDPNRMKIGTQIVIPKL